MMPRLAFGHPSRQRLATWLDGGDDRPGVTEHVEHCERCASVLESLADDGHADDLGGDIDQAIGDALREAYAPPHDMEGRVLDEIARREKLSQELNVLLGIFSIPRDTAELVMPPDSTTATRRPDELKE